MKPFKIDPIQLGTNFAFYSVFFDFRLENFFSLNNNKIWKY